MDYNSHSPSNTPVVIPQQASSAPTIDNHATISGGNSHVTINTAPATTSAPSATAGFASNFRNMSQGVAWLTVASLGVAAGAEYYEKGPDSFLGKLAEKEKPPTTVVRVAPAPVQNSDFSIWHKAQIENEQKALNARIDSLTLIKNSDIGVDSTKTAQVVKSDSTQKLSL